MRERILRLLCDRMVDVDHQLYEDVIGKVREYRVLWDRDFQNEALKGMAELERRCAVGPLPLKLLVMEEHHRMLRSLGSRKRLVLVDEHSAQIGSVLNTYCNQKDFERLEEKAFSIYFRTRMSQHHSVLEELDAIKRNPLYNDVSLALSFEAKRNHYMAHIAQCRIENDREGMIRYLELVVGLWEAHPEQIERRPFVYQRMLINLLNGYYDRDHTAQYVSTYDKAIAVKLNSKKGMAANTIGLMGAKLLYFMNTRQLNAALALRPELEVAVERHLSMAPYAAAINLLFNMASVFFLNDDKREAKRWYNMILVTRSDLRYDLHGITRIMMLLCDFNREHSELHLPTVRSIKRFYDQHEEISTFEEVVFKCVQGILNSSREEQSRYLMETLSAIDQMEVRKNEILGGESVQCWIMAKLQGTNIRTAYESLR